MQIPLPDTGLTLPFDSLTFSVVRKAPRMLVFGQHTMSYGPYVGFDADMRVYVAQHMYVEQAEKIGLTDKDLAWMSNSNWLILGSDQRVTIDFFHDLLPTWFNLDIALATLRLEYGDDKAAIPVGQIGRFESDCSVYTCVRNAMFGCLTKFGYSDLSVFSSLSQGGGDHS